MQMMAFGHFVPPWLCKSLDGGPHPMPRSWARVSDASRLRRALKSQEGRLQDLCSASKLSAVLDDAHRTSGCTGLWRKDKEQSDSMDEAFEAIQLPWLYRRATGFLKNLVVEDTEEYFKTVLKAGGIMDVVEQYPWSGEDVIHKRRDKRKGTHTGCVVRTDEGPQLRLIWNAPYGGEATDTFTLSNGSQTLTHHSRIKLRDTGQVCSYKTVYHRSRSAS